MGRTMKAFNSKRALCGDYRLPRQMLQEQPTTGTALFTTTKWQRIWGFLAHLLKDRPTSASFHRCCMKFLARSGLKTVVSVRII